MIEEIRISRVPNTEFVCLADDSNLTPTAIKRGTIVIEDELLALPCISALGRGNNVVDVGAFVGDTAIHFLSKGCNVEAFEPSMDAYVCLLHNGYRVASWSQAEFKAHNRAVGNGEPYTGFSDSIKGNLGTRSVHLDPDLDGRKHCVSLDSTLTFHPVHLLKIDAEGSEVHVLDGARNVIARDKPTILCEIYPAMLARFANHPDDIYRILTELEYKWEVAIGVKDSERWDIIATPA